MSGPTSSGEAPRWREALKAPEWGLVAGILAILAVIYFLEPSRAFFSPYSQRTLIHQVALFGVLAIGVAVVIIAGGIDLSIGSVVALSSVVVAKLITEWLPGAQASGGAAPPSTAVVATAIGLTLLMGLLIGLAHAFMINRLQLPPFIATLATLAGLRSLAQIISQDRSINVSFDNFRLLGRDPWYTVPIFAAVALAASVMMGNTVLGRHLYALGGNEMASRLSGLPTRRLKAVAYGLSGMLSALGGILFTGRSGQGQSTMGVAYELHAITAAVVGGCSLAGGIGSIRGTVLGLCLIQIIIKGTGQVVRDVDTTLFGRHIAFHVNATQVEGLVLGTVIVLAVAFNQRLRSRQT
jgi:ribose/xylose/arabinose/galactoside ABC-type transport system permease subunit